MTSHPSRTVDPSGSQTPDLFRRMLTIRLVEDRLQQMCFRGEAGDLHFSKGQEAIAVGVCAALRPTDHIVTHHRTIAHEIAKGADLYRLIAEILGKRTGFNGGIAGEMHISNHEIRHDFSFQLVGTCVPVAVGLGYALKNFQKVNEVVAVFFGDAASSNGQVHEALTIAAIHKVPLLLVCENNGLAGNITKEHYLPTPTVAERMAAYGIPARTVDGNDVDEVCRVARDKIESIRERPRPILIECMTTRLCWHKQGQRDVRSAKTLAEIGKLDPLLRCGVSGDRRAEMETEINRALDDIFARVAADPLPEIRL
jgi:TPP-dependent pyruvate/acetoin dehydrogenase alpha subunit